MPEVVYAHLDFETFGSGGGGDGHDAGVVHEDVQARGAGCDFSCGGGDGGERGEVEGEVGYGYVWVGFLEGGDRGLAFGGGAGGEVGVRGAVGGQLVGGDVA